MLLPTPTATPSQGVLGTVPGIFPVSFLGPSRRGGSEGESHLMLSGRVWGDVARLWDGLFRCSEGGKTERKAIGLKDGKRPPGTMLRSCGECDTSFM
jgi:hypothetical protein